MAWACSAGDGTSPEPEPPRAAATPPVPRAGHAALSADATPPAAHATPDAPPPVVRAAPAPPVPRAGAELLGRDVRALLPTRWIGPPPVFGSDGAPRALLLRFWTDGCPFCEASLPALEALRVELAGAGLVVAGVFHPKPARPVDDARVIAAAADRGFHGPLAVDADWSSLRRLWLDTGERDATSASFLLDRHGRLRWVHPGPELHPGDDPQHARCAADFTDLRAAVDALLAEEAAEG